MTGPRHGTPIGARRRHAQSLFLGLVGLAALLGGLTLLAVVLPGAAADERAFLSAAPCQATSTDDCLRTTWFSVDSVHIRRGKSSGGEMSLTGPEPGSRTVKFSGVSGFLERTRPGARVAGTSWRGSIVQLSDSEGGQRTDAHPVGGSLFAAGFGIVLVLAGGLGITTVRSWIRRPDGAQGGRRAPSAVTTGSVVALGLYTFGLATVLYERDASLHRFFVMWAPAAVLGAAAVLWRPLRVLLRPARRDA
ncbi:hypothetical protein ACFVU3_32330 [Streptomyces sp. NPDC058052]|uniref:hypothetical protein n=1 Tax=Streptomyces sp. NPDC058052 TaxID=3346316 RepID=UPI0036EC2AAE